MFSKARWAACYALSPHMHLRGKDAKYVLVWPDGREQVLLNVPKYDFEWQVWYMVEQQLRIPAGSKMVVTMHYDNSIKNRYNPAPDREVYWAEQSWDEMFFPFMNYTIDRMDWDNQPKAPTQEQR